MSTRRSALVADDDAVTRSFAADVLGGLGLEVHEAADGVDALRLYYARGPFALFVTDVFMSRMGGPEVVEILSARTTDMRVLFISAHNVGPLLGPTRRFLGKPFTARALRREASRLLGEPAELGG
ncbi:MAG: response regulator [Myxococcota bacterium]